MHLIIANQIAEKIPISNKAAFLIGGMAPDAVSPKELSHFFDGNQSDFSRRIDYEKFYEKYSSIEQRDYILGYRSEERRVGKECRSGLCRWYEKKKEE